jgi:MFS family permease
MIPALFFADGLLMIGCLMGSPWLFFFCRSFQGMIAGVQTGIIFGLLGDRLKKRGFADFTLISGVVSASTAVVLTWFSSKFIIIILSLIIVCSVPFFMVAAPTVEHKEIDLQMSGWGWAIILGCLLGVSLAMITQQKVVLMKFMDRGSTFVAVFPFLVSVLFSKYARIQTAKFIFLFSSLSVLFLFGSFIFQSAPLVILCTIFGVALVFGVFSLANPLICGFIVEGSENRFSSSLSIFFIRSVFTALSCYFFNRVGSTFCLLGGGSFVLLCSILFLIKGFVQAPSKILNERDR